MFHRLILAAGLALAAAPAGAFDIDAMTEAERDAFRAEIRAYLLDNPEVLIEAISVLEARQEAAQAQSDADLILSNSDAIYNDGASFVGGNPEGDITIVEFLDYRCGYCKQSHPEVTQLLGDDGNIRFIIKEYPILGEQSVLAARFALSVKQVEGDQAYFDVHNALMQDRGQVTEGSLRRLARSLDLDARAIMNGMDAPEIDSIIQANYALAQALRISGTPGFIIGQTMMRGYAPLESMQAIVAEERGS